MVVTVSIPKGWPGTDSADLHSTVLLKEGRFFNVQSDIEMQTVIKSNMTGTGRHWMKFALCRTGRQAVRYTYNRHGTRMDRLYCVVLPGKGRF